ncbi:MAG TPA: hypothetical protein VM285_11260, partial [Polyangia bacterium]|nr:hypothetical protein [Polyangia bacterium]
MPLTPRLLALPGCNGISVFVETGTADGDGVALALAHGFERAVSVELDERLAERAAERFRGDPRVTVLCGDSGPLLGTVLAG